jgi:hypothetical protein
LGENGTDLRMLADQTRGTSLAGRGQVTYSFPRLAAVSRSDGDDRMEERPVWALPGYNERQAAHFRALASTATTAHLKARLLREAEEHEQIARGEPVLAVSEN